MYIANHPELVIALVHPNMYYGGEEVEKMDVCELRGWGEIHIENEIGGEKWLVWWERNFELLMSINYRDYSLR